MGKLKRVNFAENEHRAAITKYFSKLYLYSDMPEMQDTACRTVSQTKTDKEFSPYYDDIESLIKSSRPRSRSLFVFNKYKGREEKLNEYRKNLTESRSKSCVAFPRTGYLIALQAITELSCIFHFYVPFVSVKYNGSAAALRAYFPRLNSCAWRLPDMTVSGFFGVVSMLSNWCLFALFLPLLISYLFNFSRGRLVEKFDRNTDFISEKADKISLRVVRTYKFDPLVFSSCKLLLHCYLYVYGPYATFSSFGGFGDFTIVFHVSLGFYSFFIEKLGILPVVIGAFTVVLCLYSRLRY